MSEKEYDMSSDATRGSEMVDWLKRAGILREGDSARRVIIDIPCDGLVSIWVERLDSAKMLALAPSSCRDAVITVLEKPEPEPEP